ncbi:hypothetical protein LINPERHAP2_LOCUS38081, partial [Linum perenne]
EKPEKSRTITDDGAARIKEAIRDFSKIVHTEPMKNKKKKRRPRHGGCLIGIIDDRGRESVYWRGVSTEAERWR